MGADLEMLNASQLEAASWSKGPVLVLAGPGSGKTLVLTSRIAMLIRASPKEHFRVLGLTFTRKAATEMRLRIEDLLPEGKERVHLTTFHAFAADILRQHGSHAGVRPDFTILNQEKDRQAVLLDAIRRLERSGVTGIEETDIKLLPLIDRLMDSCLSAEEVPGHIRDPELREKMRLLYSAYFQELTDKNCLDFSALLVVCHRLLVARPAIAKHLRSVYPHVCVDEFQDTNVAQYRMLRALLGKGFSKLFVVGDDDQIIFQWNGAAPERLRQLITDYGMHVVQLPESYRCPPKVIELANSLILHNVDRSADKVPLRAVKRIVTPDVVRWRSFPDFEDEMAWLAMDIAARPSGERAGCVVLGRTRRLLGEAVRILEEHGVKAVLVARKNEFLSAPLRFVHSALRLANARADREQLRRLCKAFFEVGGVDIRVDRVVPAAAALGGDFLRGWVDEARAAVSPKTAMIVDAVSKTLVERLDFWSFIDSALTWADQCNSELGGSAEQGFVDYAEERQAWKDLEWSVRSTHGREGTTLQILLHEFDLAPKGRDDGNQGVRCMTIHSAKGMEFMHVYLVGLVEEELPSFEAIKKGEQSREIQEERRNCFVAITRAQLTLTLTWAETYFGWDKEPSRFLDDMGLTGD